MAALRDRVRNRPAEKPRSSIEPLAKRAAEILHPLLVTALFPQTFTGNLGVSVHLQDGSVCHIKEFASSHTKPGRVSKVDAVGDSDVANILESATRDLQSRFESLAPGYFGVIMLTLEIERGVCTLVTCSHERIHRPAKIAS